MPVQHICRRCRCPTEQRTNLEARSNEIAEVLGPLDLYPGPLWNPMLGSRPIQLPRRRGLSKHHQIMSRVAKSAKVFSRQ